MVEGQIDPPLPTIHAHGPKDVPETCKYAQKGAAGAQGGRTQAQAALSESKESASADLEGAPLALGVRPALLSAKDARGHEPTQNGGLQRVRDRSCWAIFR